jgi:hypothetical protein
MQRGRTAVILFLLKEIKTMATQENNVISFGNDDKKPSDFANEERMFTGVQHEVRDIKDSLKSANKMMNEFLAIYAVEDYDSVKENAVVEIEKAFCWIQKAAENARDFALEYINYLQSK